MRSASRSDGGRRKFGPTSRLDSTGKLLHAWPNGGEGIAVDPKGDRLYETFSDRTPVVRALTLPAG
jgi:hypothetical protein